MLLSLVVRLFISARSLLVRTRGDSFFPPQCGLHILHFKMILTKMATIMSPTLIFRSNSSSWSSLSFRYMHFFGNGRSAATIAGWNPMHHQALLNSKSLICCHDFNVVRYNSFTIKRSTEAMFTTWDASRIRSTLLPKQLSALQPKRTAARSLRLFGTKPTVPSAPDGVILISDDQSTLSNINLDSIKQSIHSIRNILGYRTYDICLCLCDDATIQEMNLETREMDEPTDILSFPMYDEDEIVEPGILPAIPEFDIPDYYSLGDMMISVPYVVRRCEEDKKEYDAGTLEMEDRGVSGAMSIEFNPERRLHMLLIHGMLHLVGYDHIKDEDYEIMLKKENEILELLKNQFCRGTERNTN